jgi:hypothetical protein
MTTTEYLDPEGMLKLVNGYLKANESKFQLKSTAKYLQLVAKNIEAMAPVIGSSPTRRGDASHRFLAGSARQLGQTCGISD